MDAGNFLNCVYTSAGSACIIRWQCEHDVNIASGEGTLGAIYPFTPTLASEFVTLYRTRGKIAFRTLEFTANHPITPMSDELRTQEVIRPRGLQNANWPREDHFQRTHDIVFNYTSQRFGWTWDYEYLGYRLNRTHIKMSQRQTTHRFLHHLLLH